MTTEIGVMVRVNKPPGMTTESTLDEIARAIGFGSPTVELVYELEIPEVNPYA